MIFPGLQGGPNACSVCFKEALSNDFKTYTKNVIKNAKVLSKDYQKKVSKFFWNRYILILDLRSFNVTGKDAQTSLGKANITCNKNGIPFDTEEILN